MATTAHGIEYPTDYTDRADVPGVLADMATTVESALTAQDSERADLIAQFEAAGPIGMIVAYGGTSAPTGWHLCDGTAHGSSALQAVLGSANTPNLRDRFIVGAGSSYARGATGGAATVTLTGAQSGVAAHTHTASSASDNADHTHGFTTGSAGAHSHTVSGTTGTGGNGYIGNYMLQGDNPPNEGVWMVTQTVETLYNLASHTHSVSGTAASTGSHAHSGTTGGRGAYHQHAITVAAASAANAASAHENRPPYYALTYIIKKV